MEAGVLTVVPASILKVRELLSTDYLFDLRNARRQ